MSDPDHPDSPIKTPQLNRFLRKIQRELGLVGEVNVRITSDREMRRLNREFRGKDMSTDVLSFPPAQNGKVKLAGDIAISSKIAQENARALDHSEWTELKIIIQNAIIHPAVHAH